VETVKFHDEELNEDLEFYVLEQTQINGNTFLLVTEEEEGDSDAFILKQVNGQEDELVYELVEDDNVLDGLAKIFAELLEDVDFSM
jgi:redox-regulated HSP33 family molecular chaperone